MIENTLDNYAHNNGLKDVNSYFKVLFAISTMLISLISASPIVPSIIFLLVSALIIFKAKIPSKFYLKFITIPFIFAFMTFIFMALFFGISGQILNLGIFNLTIAADGFNLGLLVLTRMMAGFSCLAFLALTTPLNEIFPILEHLNIPKILLELAMLMYRYIFVFLDEAINMYHSQETRLGYSSLQKTLKSMGMLVSNLFIKTWARGEQVYMAMESRGYDGTLKPMKIQESPKRMSFFLLASFEVLLVVGVYLTTNFKLIG